ncbi:MAG: ABC transporter ATP-binding protein [Clostridia bacterium]|nr:ABC transporter ATP-binding protein [Clostridia bacterium]
MADGRAGASVKLAGLDKWFGKNHVVRDLHLDIKPGTMTTFLGPSGCGKTTTLRMIAGFQEPDHGRISIGDRDITDVPAYRRNTAMVFQEYALFPHMTVAENVGYGLLVRGIRADERKRRVRAALELVELDGMGDRFPGQLSGGQQQRVALARALIVEPDALLLDEPLSNLDAKLRESVRMELHRIQRRTGITAIYVTHDQEEAFALSDEVVVMSEGRIQQAGPPDEVYYHPANRFVAEFVGTINLAPALVTEVSGSVAAMQCASAEVVATGLTRPIRAGQTVVIGVRPESVQLCSVGEPLPTEDANVLPGRIAGAAFLGHKLRYTVEVPFGSTPWVVDQFDPGSSVGLSGEVSLVVPRLRTHVMSEE